MSTMVSGNLTQMFQLYHISKKSNEALIKMDFGNDYCVHGDKAWMNVPCNTIVNLYSFLL